MSDSRDSERRIQLPGLLEAMGGLAEYRALLESLTAGGRRDLPLVGQARAYLIAALAKQWSAPLLVVTPKPVDARHLVEELERWTPQPEQVLLLPEPDGLPYERVRWSRETVWQRVRALAELASGGPCTVVAPWRGLAQPTLPPRLYHGMVRVLETGQGIDRDELARYWHRLGYEPVSLVVEPGEFSVRGGILDVFPMSDPHPVRIELWGDTIESLRRFDPASQRSLEPLERLRLTPAREALPGRGPDAARAWQSLPLDGLHELNAQEIGQDLERLERREIFAGMEFYLPCLLTEWASPLDYLGEKALLIVLEPEEVETTAYDHEDQARELKRHLVAEGALPLEVRAPYFEWSDLGPRLLEAARLSLLPPRAGEDGLGERFTSTPHFAGRLDDILAGSEEARRRGERVVVVSRQAARLAEVYAQRGQPQEPRSYLQALPPPRSLTLLQGILGQGFRLRTEEGGLTVFSDRELFGWVLPAPRRRIRPAAADLAWTDIEPGDYAVHIEQGIGRFEGLAKLELNGSRREYLKLVYAEGDELFVPTHQADRVSRYVGANDQPPRITRLGTADWSRARAAAKKAIEDLAEDLLALYAQRETVPGRAGGSDTPWQAELEAAFPYEETEDQLRAIEAVKQDIEAETPMDRLVCGDVGYGKTEVAVRAAFKAVMDGQQVGVLVPTTVLAQQHYYTFRQRMASFPVEVEMLSRFRTPKEQKDILARLESGAIDVIIGTHRLLQRDVRFKDLGLLVIDEEQRFGVSHKERLKQFRTEVDVLTLTATPIPRTLHMALVGVRDLSSIDTPPEERRPVVTKVTEYDEELIRQAIVRELSRGGQVYFVHNRVQGIQEVAARVRTLVPEARVAVGHGQMNEHELERIMLALVEGSLDVLVCTSIIENGLDIPNCNTLIVNRAHRFGLSQLYQLRGRVGRSARRAYAYFLYPRNVRLNERVRKRLRTIQEAAELGSGYRIAMHDLEIRGAGDILGSRQHGHIAAIGFELYCKLLAQAVRDLKEGRTGGVRLEDSLEASLGPAIDLPVEAYLPESYVSDDALRLQLYRRMAALRSVNEVADLYRALRDRFGEPPQPVYNLLSLLRIKALGRELGIVRVGREGGQMVLRVRSEARGQEQVKLPIRGVDAAALGKLEDTLRSWSGKKVLYQRGSVRS